MKKTKEITKKAINKVLRELVDYPNISRANLMYISGKKNPCIGIDTKLSIIDKVQCDKIKKLIPTKTIRTFSINAEKDLMGQNYLAIMIYLNDKYEEYFV